jgi:hypothetical protein
MNKTVPYEFVLNEILKRERVPIPSILLNGKRFCKECSVYNTLDIKKLSKDQKGFHFTPNDSPINFDDYEKELLYLKLFTSNSDNSVWKHITKGTCIIKISDFEKEVFYMYIKLVLKSNNETSDDNNQIKYKIVYTPFFDDLVRSIYKTKEIPNFLNSEAFVSTNDKTREQSEILEEHAKTLITNVEYDKQLVKVQDPDTLSEWVPFNDVIKVVIDYYNRTISAVIAGKNVQTQYKVRHECFVNDILTKGSDTATVNVYLYKDSLKFIIKNDIETLKEFRLKEN